MIMATIRDIAIIIIALQSIVIGGLLGLLVWQIWRLVKTLQADIKPIIQDAQATVNTVRGTATFVSDNGLWSKPAAKWLVSDAQSNR